MSRLGRAVLGGMVTFGLLAAVPAAVFAAQPACGDTLNHNTTLTADLDCSAYVGDALTMGHNRVVLNLNGHTIWGYTGADSYSGVNTNSYNHTVIKNGTVANAGTEIYVYYSNDTFVKNVEVYGEAADTSSAGVGIYYGAGNQVTGLNAHDLYEGLYSENTADTQVLNSTMDTDTYGVYTEYDSHDRFEGNTFKNGTYGIYDDYSGNNRYISNVAKNNSSSGFYLDCDTYGNTTLKNNLAKNNGAEGFYLYYCYADNGYAPGHGSTISGNLATGNSSYGFYDYYSINAVWTGNTATNNDSEGFYMLYPGGDTMTGNKANSNGSDGFYFYDNYSSGYQNLYDFSHNKASNNDGYGFDADYGVPGHDNTAHNNASGNCYNVRCN